MDIDKGIYDNAKSKMLIKKKTLIQNIALFLGTKIFAFHLKNNDELK